jgi:hypothetical protein
MRFISYLTEYRITNKLILETWNDIPWIYNKKSGLWYIIDGKVYNNGSKKGKIIKVHYDFAWSHRDLEKYNSDLQGYDLCGRIQENNTLKIYNYILDPIKSKFFENKAINAIYKYIPERSENEIKQVS